MISPRVKSRIKIPRAAKLRTSPTTVAATPRRASHFTRPSPTPITVVTTKSDRNEN